MVYNSTALSKQVAFQICSGRYESGGISADSNNGGSRRCRPAASHESLSSLPPRIPPPSRRSSLHSNASNTSSPVHPGHSAAAGLSRNESMHIMKQSNLVLENPGIQTFQHGTTLHIAKLLLSFFLMSAAFQSSASVLMTDQPDEDEREYKLHVLDPAEDCSSFASSNRSSIVSDTDLLVRS